MIGAKPSPFFRRHGREWIRTPNGERLYSGKRDLRRSHGWPSGRQWRRLRKSMAAEDRRAKRRGAP